MSLESLIKITGVAALLSPTLRSANSLSAPRPPSRARAPACTFLAVHTLEAQGAVTLVALLPGPAAAPVGTGARHARVGGVVHVHAPGEVVLHVDGAVVQGDLGERQYKEIQDLRRHLCGLSSVPLAH